MKVKELTKRIEDYVRDHCPLLQSRHAMAEAFRQGYYEGRLEQRLKPRWHVCSDNTMDVPRDGAMCAVYVIVYDDEVWSPEKRIIFAKWLGNTWDFSRYENRINMEAIRWTYAEELE